MIVFYHHMLQLCNQYCNDWKTNNITCQHSTSGCCIVLSLVVMLKIEALETCWIDSSIATTCSVLYNYSLIRQTTQLSMKQKVTKVGVVWHAR